jgi:hypothetical protein
MIEKVYHNRERPHERKDESKMENFRIPFRSQAALGCSGEDSDEEAQSEHVWNALVLEVLGVGIDLVGWSLRTDRRHGALERVCTDGCAEIGWELAKDSMSRWYRVGVRVVAECEGV